MKSKQQSEAAPVSGQHTPGPWEIGYSEMWGHQVLAKDPDTSADDSSRLILAQSHNLANARLIASAPALLEALHQITKLPVRYDVCPRIASEMYEIARAAIAQAEGRVAQ